MVLSQSDRKIKLLVIANNRNEGSLIASALLECIGSSCISINIFDDVVAGYSHFLLEHSDVVITLDLPSCKSEALAIRIRKIAGQRHTGILVMAPVNEHFDRLAEDNYNAGVDDVISLNMSTMILKSKILAVFNLKLASDNLRNAVHRLHQMTMLDELTGLANMRGFLKALSHSMELNSKSGMGIVMMDLDRFKSINDSTNHMVGSHVIKTVGGILRDNPFRGQSDISARYGGDEFIMIVHGHSLDSQVSKVDSIRHVIESTRVTFQGFDVRVTASLGLCWVEPGFNGKPEDIVKFADSMLYRSKELGRNKLSYGVLSSGGNVFTESSQSPIGASSVLALHRVA